MWYDEPPTGLQMTGAHTKPECVRFVGSDGYMVCDRSQPVPAACGVKDGIDIERPSTALVGFVQLVERAAKAAQ